MNSNTKGATFLFIKQKQETTVKEIADHLPIGRQMVHRHLHTLLEEGKIDKFGSAPKVFYRIAEKETFKTNLGDYHASETVTQNFVELMPNGKLLRGSEAFVYWCKQRGHINFEEWDKKYTLLVKQVENLKVNGYLNATPRLKGIFSDSLALDELFYLEPYAIEIFGRSTLSKLILLAKDDASLNSVMNVVNITKGRLQHFISKGTFDAIGFIPPSINREVQLMDKLRQTLEITQPNIKLTKIISEYTRPQKGLKTIEERIINARDTIFVEDSNKYKRILLIDDATGSGATLNEVAKKLRRNNLVDGGSITGITLVGSLKGFDIISGI